MLGIYLLRPKIHARNPIIHYIYLMLLIGTDIIVITKNKHLSIPSILN